MKHPLASRRQRGFTLVEIAIVLLIVGLLIGGILRGQELITSARVRNIIDQKTSVLAAYTGFQDRYRMLPGDLTAAQARLVEGGALASNAAGGGAVGDGGGNGVIAVGTESTLFFQNLTASGFLSCGACMSFVLAAGAAGPAPTINNSPVNVYGDFLQIGHIAGAAVPGAGGYYFPAGTFNFVMLTGAGIPSQVLAETDRKADDGLPGRGHFVLAVTGASGGLAQCAPNLSTTNPDTPWILPSIANCAGAWLL